MVNFAYNYHLPTAEELPDSDDTPVDNQLQNDIPNLLLRLLYSIWAGRQDWYFGVDMGIYYNPNSNIPIVPDGFLALGVECYKSEGGRLSYVLWEERYEIPKLVLEVVSQTYNGEYETKLSDYQAMGILYYVVYNPLSGRRGAYKQHQPLEVHKLISGVYQLMQGSPTIWLPEIGLGIGCERGTEGGWTREWVYWYDEHGVRYPTAEEVRDRAEKAKEQAEKAKEQAEAIASQERAIANQERIAKQEAEAIALSERQQKEKLATYLRSLGINPDRI